MISEEFGEGVGILESTCAPWLHLSWAHDHTYFIQSLPKTPALFMHWKTYVYWNMHLHKSVWLSISFESSGGKQQLNMRYAVVAVLTEVSYCSQWGETSEKLIQSPEVTKVTSFPWLTFISQNSTGTISCSHQSWWRPFLYENLWLQLCDRQCQICAIRDKWLVCIQSRSHTNM